jgi:hypothetical protein
MTADVRQINLERKGVPKSPAPEKVHEDHGRSDLDFHKLVHGNDDGMKENPRLKLNPVPVNPIFLP